jgi:hypothetical protein
MTDKPDLHVEMQGDYIIITLCVQLDSFQLFFDVTTKIRPGTKVTLLLPHFGHCSFTASCSEMVSVRSNFFPHFSQRY